MMEHIRGQGLNGDQILHAIPVEPDLWHAVDHWRSAGVSIYTRESLITRIADMIGEGHLYSLDIKDWRGQIDRAGNVWIDREYLSPHQYLPRMITP